MRVLQKGSGQTGWAKECTCSGRGNGGGGCGAVLLVDESDLFKTSNSSYDGSSESFTTFECPECTVWTDVDSVPSHVVERLRSRSPSSRGRTESDNSWR